MGLKLIFSGASPYVRKVDVALREVGLRDSVETIPTQGTMLNPDKTRYAANPLGKVPALIRDNGPTLYDSRVICRYIDHLSGGGLYPESRLFDILTLEATADGILDAAVGMVYEVRLRPEGAHSQEVIEAYWYKIERALDALETLWMSHLQGPVTMAQIAVGCALGYLDLRHGSRNWRDGRPELAAWFAAFEDRPSMQATRPVG